MERFLRSALVACLTVALCAPAALAHAPAGREAETVSVKMADRYRNVFRPRTVRIERGDTVTWVNVGDITHTATGQGWDSGAVAPGGRWSRRFRTVGTYRYRCLLHPEMTGSVVVE